MKILIQTALSLEFEAVKVHLSEVITVTHPVTKSIYTLGKYIKDDFTFEIMLSETGAGNVRSADETSRAIAYFEPDYVFFVGIAGGIKDVDLGDVVVSSKVVGIEVGKDDVEFLPRFDSVPASYILEQIGKHIKREGTWQNGIPQTDQLPRAFVQPIAAGEKVVSSNRSTTFQNIRKYCSDAVAVDMEGNGFLVAARPFHVHAIEVRGISDLIESKEESDRSGSQPTAAVNASAFTFAMIDQLAIQTNLTQNINTPENRKKLVDKLLERYPQGPDQDDIWKRAGGDVSILVNSSSRRSQWYNAIEKLALGGGGKNISLSSLVNEVESEFSGFTSDTFGQ